MPFAELSYTMQQSTHGVTGINGGKGKYPLNISQKKSFIHREISFEYLTEEKFYPFCTSDTYFIDPYKQYPVTICGQRVILTNGNLAEALSSLPEKRREIIYLYFFGRYTQQEIGELYGRCRSTAWHRIHSALQMLHEEMEVLSHE
jgi:DNA-directed RNA polymerase specialized sigma subunit